ncbi:MAG: hypothetical protein WBN29_02580, partial [Polyangiales bacterium]
MASGKPGSSGSSFPSVLGDKGTIDLVGGSTEQDIHERPTRRLSGDAWVVDRDRRSLPPTAPPPAQPEAGDADPPSPD